MLKFPSILTSSEGSLAASTPDARAILNAKPKDKPYKLTDGDGLLVLIQPSGAKTRIFQYRLSGKRSEVTIGRFPEIGAGEAREQAQKFRAMVELGESPVAYKREEKRAAQYNEDGRFKAFSLVWLDERMSPKTEGYRTQVRSFLERFVWPEIGDLSLAEVKPRPFCGLSKSCARSRPRPKRCVSSFSRCSSTQSKSC